MVRSHFRRAHEHVLQMIVKMVISLDLLLSLYFCIMSNFFYCPYQKCDIMQKYKKSHKSKDTLLPICIHTVGLNIV